MPPVADSTNEKFFIFIKMSISYMEAFVKFGCLISYITFVTLKKAITIKPHTAWL
jgi:hypothetical protein